MRSCSSPTEGLSLLYRRHPSPSAFSSARGGTRGNQSQREGEARIGYLAIDYLVFVGDLGLGVHRGKKIVIGPTFRRLPSAFLATSEICRWTMLPVRRSIVTSTGVRDGYGNRHYVRIEGDQSQEHCRQCQMQGSVHRVYVSGKCADGIMQDSKRTRSRLHSIFGSRRHRQHSASSGHEAPLADRYAG